MASTNQEYSTRVIGAPNTLENRTFIERNGKVVSSFHDIPLFADESKNILNSEFQATKERKAFLAPNPSLLLSP